MGADFTIPAERDLSRKGCGKRVSKRGNGLPTRREPRKDGNGPSDAVLSEGGGFWGVCRRENAPSPSTQDASLSSCG